MGAGAEVVVHGGHLMLKPSPDPSDATRFRLYPDNPDDPWAFRVRLPEFGMELRVVFDGGGSKERTARRASNGQDVLREAATSAIRDGC